MEKKKILSIVGLICLAYLGKRKFGSKAIWGLPKTPGEPFVSSEYAYLAWSQRNSGYAPWADAPLSKEDFIRKYAGRTAANENKYGKSQDEKMDIWWEANKHNYAKMEALIKENENPENPEFSATNIEGILSRGKLKAGKRVARWGYERPKTGAFEPSSYPGETYEMSYIVSPKLD